MATPESGGQSPLADELAALKVSSRRDAGPLYARHNNDVKETEATLSKEHDRAERRLGAAFAEQHRARGAL